ncbi:hypothetical protein QBC37DRAFT_378293 [Rhypophila decipiens]|uniref:Uncharacterized protein n=1 Tax=Rhypophila decipiens TaxID=261697 RepID=A0AAN6Y0Q9_9PEZI|nr:hypothetical protein QBC37DRAFT_378293 [Rhypophila decipiens]
MATNYNITIINTSGATQSYLLFAVVPKVNATSGEVYTNVFMAAPPIISKPNGSSQTYFNITREFYAICGTSIRNLSAGVQVGTSDYEPVVLGTNQKPGTTMSFTTADGAHFPMPPPAATAPNGGYTIATDSSFKIPNPNNTFIGLGGMNMNGNVVPVATFLAAPSTTYNIYPVVKYYIATGTYSPGEIINVQSIGVTQLVDFTSSTYNSVTYMQLNDGTYQLVSPTQAKEYKLLRLKMEKAKLLGYEQDFKEEEGKGSTRGDSGEGEPLARELQDVFMKMLRSVEATAHGNGNGHANGKPVKASKLVAAANGGGLEEEIL